MKRGYVSDDVRDEEEELGLDVSDSGHSDMGVGWMSGMKRLGGAGGEECTNVDEEE